MKPCPRPLRPEEWPRLQHLLQRVHERPTPDSYCAEYPLMLEPDNADGLWVMPGPDGELLSHVGTLTRTLKIGPLRLAAALVGSVATDPTARGRGLARRTLEAAHAALRAQGVLIAFLWSEPRRLYLDAGYHPVGESLVFRIDPDREPVDPGLKCRPVAARDEAEIAPLLAQRFSALERTADEHRRLSRIVGVEGFVGVRSGKVVSVLYVGKGSDLKDIGHDWAGGSEEVIRLAIRLAARRRTALGLLTPGLPDETAAAALGRRWPHTELPVAQACVLDPAGLVRALSSYLPSEILGELEEAIAGRPGPVPLVQRLFGPAPGLAGSLLPLPLFIWGLDSM